ncbi:hypothetical protein LTR56_003016 [Elasticomyces elasticus]|nr:hypothetical protein LTR56_003016 [Elasticomyces elasticus]KAK3662079.1 hypothetical protein LTR22_007051 [Elasticomyces elasticus]KAK4927558.1 hypothetical protein LTR49_005699 [Elasticomyces elasticus]
MPFLLSESQVQPKSIRFAIDRGGTFTDVWASIPNQPEVVIKLLSVDPGNYADAPAEGIRRVLEQITNASISRNDALPKEFIHSIRMGTTVATNALLERKGTRHALVVTAGFRDILDIGFQSRPNLFELGIRKPELLYDQVVEIDERITVEGFDEDPNLGVSTAKDEISGTILVKGTTGDVLRIIKPLDEAEVLRKLAVLKSEGIDTLAVCLVHSYLYPHHETRVAELSVKLGFRHVSISSKVGSNMVKLVPRGSSASADAYLTPEIKRYIQGFAKRFEGGDLDGVACEFMQSDGGLVNHKNFSGLRGILSGPAGGVVGYARTSYDGKTPLVGFDMGGTSTDVSRFGGTFEHVFETTTAGVTIQSPQLDINTVAAGGGSRLFWDNGLFKVGPESAGAHPGPASYRKGGPLTVTDANLFLGRLIPDFFPMIFGPNENLPLDLELVKKKFGELTQIINAETGRDMSPLEIAHGFIDVANESMSRPIRALTEARGHETAQHTLATFGGAGGQHACEMAEKLGIRRIVVHKYSSILSAYGMALAEVVQEAQEPSSAILTADTISGLQQRIELLKGKVRAGLTSQGVEAEAMAFEPYLNLRYHGTETNFMIKEPVAGDYKSTLEAEHLRELSFRFDDDKKILVDDIRVRGIGKSASVTQDSDALVEESNTMQFFEVSKLEASRIADIYFANIGLVSTEVYLLRTLQPGSIISGPAVIIDDTQTVLLVPGAKARILSSHILIDLPAEAAKKVDAGGPVEADPIKLSIFSHRFMSIAEQMGRTLQKTSLSLNIKERLDFSCAIFSPEGDLVANAPHVPVHLGSMSYAVRYQHELHRGNLKPGDVLVTNHPETGGTHLPDITVITPVFESDGKSICFYTASRGHHMDIGGWKGTSMPPDSTELWQEGAAIKSFFLIKDGHFDEEGSRRLGDNLSDLKAQIAANNRGSLLLRTLIDEYTMPVVHFYMVKIQENAELAVRNYLKSTRSKYGAGAVLRATDCMDNGSEMTVAITIAEDGQGTFDFTGTTCEMLSNMNAPPAITYSALIYTLRLLIGKDIPLNQGCLAPATVIIPKNTFLNPSEGPAVCCGNTLTSQRLVDLLLKAFGAAADSQGCMNCFGFFGRGGVDENGKDLEGFGYNYGETIAGGEGAGPSWHGASGVHVHMTNTRTTDVEILEKRYPIILREFSIRQGSGGAGRFRGGCGVVRDWECCVPLTFTMISERRVRRPHGMDGGEDGGLGANYWVKKNPDGSFRWLSIGPRGQVDLAAGDRYVIHTPGGGGWGSVDQEGALSHAANGKISNGHAVKVAPGQYPRATGSVHSFAAAQASAS